jgi:hypothetical protein
MKDQRCRKEGVSTMRKLAYALGVTREELTVGPRRE